MLFGKHFHPKHLKGFQGRDAPENEKEATGRFIYKPAELSFIAMQPGWSKPFENR